VSVNSEGEDLAPRILRSIERKPKRQSVLQDPIAHYAVIKLAHDLIYWVCRLYPAGFLCELHISERRDNTIVHRTLCKGSRQCYKYVCFEHFDLTEENQDGDKQSRRKMTQ
jgi:hypothetical protein